MLEAASERGFMNWNAEIIDDFTLREARCHGYEKTGPNTKIWHDCGLVILVKELCRCVYTVRVRFEKPIIALSWTRCVPHNLAVGGKPDSYHPVGGAIDMRPVEMRYMGELVEIADDVFPYIYTAPWGLHGDIRGPRPVHMEEGLLQSFQGKYGRSMGLRLLVFYLDWKSEGELAARAGVTERTYYNYRRILYRDGFLTDDDIKSVGNARWVK